MSKVDLLRAVTHRLNHTPVEELPCIASFLASSVRSCADVLKLASDPASGKKDDLAVQVHKLKVRLSSLLQDRTSQGRFTAVVLIKATVEAGGRDAVAGSEPWLRGMVAILNKQGPVSSKNMCLLTITRIFSLTKQYPTLVREMTTPLLPAFVTACINLGGLHQSQSHEVPATRPSPCLKTILQCFLHLIPHHPSTFRPFVPKLRAGLAHFIGGWSSPQHIDKLAQSVFVMLHFCAPKKTAGEEWLCACKAVILCVHEVMDEIFRAIVEDWEPTDIGRRQPSMRKTYDGDVGSAGGGSLGLPSWRGVYQGSRVLISLLQLLQASLLVPTAQAVDMPLGSILDLTSRLMSNRVPVNRRAMATVRFNPEVTRDEREELLAVLPEMHQSALALLSGVVMTLGLSVLPASHAILDQCFWVFEPGGCDDDVRLATYDLLFHLIPLIGPSMTKDKFKVLLPVIAFCCKDTTSAMVGFDALNTSFGANIQSLTGGHADSFLQNTPKKAKQPAIRSRFDLSVARLLCRVLEFVPAHAIPHSLRAQIDRTAILNEQKQNMFASVLNPPPKTTDKHTTPSLMPFLARTSQGHLGAEGLLRPRMPPIFEGGSTTFGVDSESEAEEGLVDHIELNVLNKTNYLEEEVSAHLLTELPEGQNDLLDKLENSIANGTDAAPKTVTSQEDNPVETTANSSLDEKTSNGISDFMTGVKRGHDEMNAKVEETSTKRFQPSVNGGEKKASFLVAETPNNTKSNAVAGADIDDANAVPSLKTENGVDSGDKPQSSCVNASTHPRPNMLSNFEEKEGLVDDESDFEMPTLYLKTSSEEDDDDDDDAASGTA